MTKSYLDINPATTVADRQTDRTFSRYSVTPDRSTRRGWLCYVTDDRDICSATHFRTKAQAIAWGEALVHGA